MARKIAQALNDAGVRTLLCDNNWSNISAARMQGLETYYGQPVSSHAEVHLELTGLGGMLGLSRNPAENTSAALRFREDFSPRKIFLLATEEDDSAADKSRANEAYTGRILFDTGLDYWRLHRSVVYENAQIKNTKLSEAYPFEQWQSDNGEKTIAILFALDEKQDLIITSGDASLEPKADWTLYWLTGSGNDARQNRTEQPAEGGANSD
ncbi:MAG: hypothetical protein U5K56_17925 [Halioglobus sp.]|nr:hypothetical protein [Halioglobus sp.]